MKLFTLQLISLLLLCFILNNFTHSYKYKSKKNFEIQEDFIVPYEYALEKTGKNWTDRGSIEFRSKNAGKNFNSNAFAVSNDFTEEEKEEINNECKQNGLIVVRVKLNTGTYLISSIKAVYYIVLIIE